MDKQALLDLADHIENNRQISFSMRHSLEECHGSGDVPDAKLAACIMGFGKNLFNSLNADSFPMRTGLGWEEYWKLCFPMEQTASWLCVDRNSPKHISRERAVRVLRHLAETGKVNWEIDAAV